MDVLDTVTHYPHVNEYVIMAADADFTPLITRLRKHMKIAVVYQAPSTAAAYRAACDSVIDQESFIAVLQRDDEEAAEEVAQKPAAPAVLDAVQPISPTRVSDTIHRYFNESSPGHQAPVASLGNLLKDEFGDSIAADWLGYPSLSQLLKRLCNLSIEKVENRMVAFRDTEVPQEK
jgi:hypothetical protein